MTFRLRLFGLRLLALIDVADDGQWDWTADNGDTHRDLVALVVVRRKGMPPILRLTVGPLNFMVLDEAGGPK